MRTTIINLQYAVRIDRLADSDGGGYLAVVPELPGCMSDGVTPEEALGHVQQAIAAWIEADKVWKLEIPTPAPPAAEPRLGTAIAWKAWKSTSNDAIFDARRSLRDAYHPYP